MGEQVVKASGNQRLRLQMEHADLLYNAGFWEEALEQITAVQKAVPDNLDVILAVAKILSKVGRVEEIMGLESLVRRICILLVKQIVFSSAGWHKYPRIDANTLL